jgi:N-acetylmuramoyl-L-alanine amidase CwlD
VPRERKAFIRILLVTVILLAFISSPAAAAVSGFVARSSDGSLYEYSYDDLLDSYALKLLGLSNGLYEDFSVKKTYALLNSSGAYIDYDNILDYYAAALLLGQKFDLNKHILDKEAKRAQMPASISAVTLNSGKLTYTDKKIPASNPESNPGENSPKTETPILGPPSITVDQAQLWALGRSAHLRFISIAPLYWHYGELTGIRPEVLYAQAALETNFGRFDNRVPHTFNNWAGIKITGADGDETENHEAFATPDDGVRAHFNHISAYVGLAPQGEPHGRYHVAARQSWAGKIRYAEELSGKWAPAIDYHVYLLALLDQMGVPKVPTNPNPEKPAETNKPDPGAGSAGSQVAVDVDVLRLRSGPGLGHDIIDRLTRGTVLKVNGSQEEWLQVVTPGGTNGWVHSAYVRKIDLSGNPFKGKIIVVDPGHGGSDPGAVGYTGLQEKVVNLAVAQNLITLLKAAGAEVIVTRSGDLSVSNLKRVELANKSGADLFVSIHANAFTNPESNGTETHYCGNNENSSASRFLAQQLQRELLSALGLRDRGVKANSFYVLTKAEMPSALVELGFITNLEEEELLKKPETQGRAAEAVYRGIEAYLLNYR